MAEDQAQTTSTTPASTTPASTTPASTTPAPTIVPDQRTATIVTPAPDDADQPTSAPAAPQGQPRQGNFNGLRQNPQPTQDEVAASIAAAEKRSKENVERIRQEAIAEQNAELQRARDMTPQDPAQRRAQFEAREAAAGWGIAQSGAQSTSSTPQASSSQESLADELRRVRNGRVSAATANDPAGYGSTGQRPATALPDYSGITDKSAQRGNDGSYTSTFQDSNGWQMTIKFKGDPRHATTFTEDAVDRKTNSKVHSEGSIDASGTVTVNPSKTHEDNNPNSPPYCPRIFMKNSDGTANKSPYDAIIVDVTNGREIASGTAAKADADAGLKSRRSAMAPH